jgi:hypothetical protein
MTEQEFGEITSNINRAASQQDINLADRANGLTVWFENPRGSGEYVLHGRAAGIEQAKALAGTLEVIIWGVQAGRIQINVWKDRKWQDGYADDRPISGGS